ncbi:hypothetical protein GBA52_006369 [Prunus armeniaca]|nr:hypothetical protein GBA52_006369 [Prunus armeniaca]
MGRLLEPLTKTPLCSSTRTIDPATKCTDYDAQTWLSTALSNLDTCRAGFVELGVSDFVLPLMSNNVSKLISNTLSIGNGSNVPAVTNRYKEGFPTWVSPGDRKLLQSLPAADVVVAQDGSGNYKTIKEALLPRRRGEGEQEMASLLVAITFRNTAGPENHQAVALRSGADLSVFYRCGFEGYQDTLYVHSQRQFYKECYVYGTVDFIFGNAAVVLQNCHDLCKKAHERSKNTITAQGRTDPNQNTGISIHDSRVMAGSDLKPVLSSVKTYLAGWLEWDGNFALKTLYYGEYKNTGPGSSTSGRVNWGGYHVITSSSEASKFTVGNFIAGSSWLPATNVPFTAGL